MIVVESGGTKSTWIFRDSVGEKRIIELGGFHPQEITANKKTAIDALVNQYQLSGRSVYFYGAGCESEAGKKTIESLLSSNELIPLVIASDVAGACIAVLQDEPGVAGILGTGAVAAYYNGHSVEQMASGRGFILGDEGSGFDIGKRATIAYLDQFFNDKDLNEKISRYYGGHDKVVHACSGPHSRFLIAGLTKIIAEHRDNEQVHAIVLAAFEDFVERAILPLPKQSEIGIVGSVGFYFQKELSAVLGTYDIALNKVVIAAAEEIFNFVESK